MTAEEFWTKYTQDDILDIFDETCDFFSKTLPHNFIENYDVGEVIIETRGHQERAKNFLNVIQFTDIIRNKQPQLYKEFFAYFDIFLIDYYCYKQDKSIDEAFSFFIDNPIQNIDLYLLGFNKILFYQHTELLEQVINNNYDLIYESDEVVNAEYDLSMCKYYMSIQEVFKEGKECLDTTDFSSKLSAYNFDFDEGFLSALETGILKPQLDAGRLIVSNNKKNKYYINIIQGYFLRYMYEKGFEFFLSGWIWDKILVYWDKYSDPEKASDPHFRIDTDSFEKYLAEFSSDWFFVNKSDMVAVLWGSVYIYEFFYKSQIISEDIFHGFLETSRELKGKMIYLHTSDLWKSNFIHTWTKPDCISAVEFTEEHNIFKKSISLENQEFTRLRSHISEELSNIGELAPYIIDGGKEDSNQYDSVQKFGLFDSFENLLVENSSGNYSGDPIRAEKKIGRNEPCPCGSGTKYKKCCGKV